MRTRLPIAGRIICAFLLVLLLMGILIFLLADGRMVSIVDKSQSSLFTQRIASIIGLLAQAEHRLELTGMREAYEGQFQERALRDLAAMAPGRMSAVSLVVYGGDGHLLWRGPAPVKAPTTLPSEIGAVDAGGPTEMVLPEGDAWGIFQGFPAWGWTIGFVVPRDVKYADVRRFRNEFTLVLLITLLAAGIVTLLLVLSIVRPITRLTKAAAAMARGDLSQPIHDGHGDEVGVLASAFTRLQGAIRERIEELSRKNEDLFREVEVRTKAENALQKAMLELERQNEELKILDRVKDGLIRDVTHELKTPVAKFRMQVELLRDLLERRGVLAEAADALGVVEHSIERQEGVIRNILNLARLEGGGSRYRKARVDLASLIGTVIEEHADLARASGVEISAALEPVSVLADGEILRHALANLVDNAIKFRRPHGEAWVRLRCGPRAGRAEVVVEDNGRGMTEEEREHAFDRFYQGSAASEGSGVGLAIVRRIVLDHGGVISLASAGRGEGTTVMITLPLQS